MKNGSEGPAGEASIGDNEALEAWPGGSTLGNNVARELAEIAMLEG